MKTKYNMTKKVMMKGKYT